MTASANSSARFLIVGPQGSGKGTQGVLVAEAFGVPSISTGDVFRENISGGTELGKRVQSIVEAGDLVPDQLTCELVRDRLAQSDAAGGFLLDGFPRNRGQVDDLADFLASRGEALDAVIELSVPRDESISRLRQRGLGHKRSLALGEFALGVEGLERFVRREPLRRVHECVFGVLALESEPVDPRL